MEQKNREVVLNLKLSQVAEDFGYKTESDQYEDVYHNGYSSDDVRFMDLSLPKGMDNLNMYFPYIVAQAMESLERADYAREILNQQMSALEECLLKIDLSGGGAEYQDMNGNFISAKAGIKSVDINRFDDTISITILNPEHLINTIINGVGMFAPDLPTDEPASIDELAKKFHNLKYFFDVYGESKLKGEVSTQYSPSINDEDFEQELSDLLSSITLEEAGQAVLDLVDASAEDYQVDCKEFARFVKYSARDIKKSALKINEKNKDTVDKKIK